MSSKATGPFKRVENWNVRNFDKSGPIKTDRKIVTKIAVRNPDGTFDGATNFRQIL